MNSVRLRLITIGITMACSVGLAHACPTCTPADRTLAQRLVHGTSPDGFGDLVIVSVMAVLVLFTGYLTVRAVLRHDHSI